MKSWVTSWNGAVALSAIAFLSFLARTLLDAQYVFHEFASTPNVSAMAILIYTALFGAWLWGLLAAVRGSRPGMIVALAMTALLCVGTAIGTLISFCPSPCKTAAGWMETANWSNFILGLAAVIVMGLQFKKAT